MEMAISVIYLLNHDNTSPYRKPTIYSSFFLKGCAKITANNKDISYISEVESNEALS